MQNPRLAARYAKSLLDLSVEKNSLEDTLRDMQAINNVCHLSRDFELMLRSPIVTSDKKLSVINLVLERYNLGEITRAFIQLLVSKGRELNLPEIAEAFVGQYNVLKNIRTVKLITAVPMSDAIKSGIAAKIAGFMPGDTVDLKTEVDESLIGGFVVEVEDKLYDASVKKSLNDFKSKLVDYSYVSKM
jgi:F-type H+-transporting ATPase subunit delta